MGGVLLAGTLGLVETLVHLGAVLAWATSLDDLLDSTFERADAHATLTVTGQSVVTGERVAASTRVWLVAGVDLSVAFQVVASYEAFAAMVAAELTVAEMGLNVGFDVFLSAEAFVAFRIGADPFVVHGVGTVNELYDVVECNVCFFNRCRYSRLKIEIGDGHSAR